MEMTEKKVYVSDDEKATFVCDACGYARTEDVSRHVNSGKTIRVRCRCKCGHQFMAIMEQRKSIRKSTRCPGTFLHIDDKGNRAVGRMTVCDISRDGMRVEIHGIHRLAVGDAFDVEFRLDDRHRSLIRKTLTVQNVNGNILGAAYDDGYHFDKALGMYLMA
jgi:formylmethanofuran dehydrogenase subunit B